MAIQLLGCLNCRINLSSEPDGTHDSGLLSYDATKQCYNKDAIKESVADGISITVIDDDIDDDYGYGCFGISRLVARFCNACWSLHYVFDVLFRCFNLFGFCLSLRICDILFSLCLIC